MAKTKPKARKIPVTAKAKKAAKAKPITVKAATRRNRKIDGGVRGRPPKGCVRKDGKLVPGKDAPKIKAIFKFYKKTQSVTRVAAKFKLPHATAHYCLTNPMYVVGKVISKGDYQETQKLLQRKVR